MASTESAVVLLASALQAASGVDSVVNLGTRDRLLRQTLAIAAVAGSSPSLQVRLEASADGATGWRTFGTFTAASGVSVEKMTFISPERYVRVAWTLTGASSPSFTFAVTGTQGIVYANLDDLDAHGMSGGALAKIPPSQRCAALAATTIDMNGKLGLRYDLPIIEWDVDIVRACCKITAYELLSVKGFNPDGDDSNVRTRYDDAWDWLNDVATSEATPVGIVDSTVDVEDDGAIGLSSTARGWR